MKFRQQLIVFCVLFTVFGQYAHGAEERCIPTGTGGPGTPPPPHFLNVAATPGIEQDRDKSLEDSRWIGAQRISFSYGAGEVVSFRALRGTNELYLSWVVYADSGVDNNDGIWVGFSNNDLNPAMPTDSVGHLFRIHFKNFNPIGTGDDQQIISGMVDCYSKQSSAAADTFQPCASPPQWLFDPNNISLSQVRVWNGVQAAPSNYSELPYYWAFEMRVPIDPNINPSNPNNYNTGLPLGSKFVMWFQTEIVMSGVASLKPWPTTTPIMNQNDPTTFSDYTQWGVFHNGDGFTCPSGISFTGMDIGVEDNGAASPLTNRLHFQLDNSGTQTVNNRLTVRISNPGASIPSGDLRARFRLADWGSQQVTSIDQSWDEIRPTTIKTNVNAIGTGYGDAINFDWALAQNDTVDNRCTYDDPPPPEPALTGCPNPSPRGRDAHQCMAVQLQAVSGVLTFNNDSIVRNMDVATASKFERSAQIGVGQNGARTPLAATNNRDYYLLLDTQNMPGQVKLQREPAKSSPPSLDTNRASQDVNRPEALQSVKNTAAFDSHLEGPRPHLSAEQALAFIKGPNTSAQHYDVNDLAAALPTYRIHAFQDTGQVITRSGVSYKVVDEMTSFGYFVDHQGTLTGWRAGLTGQSLETIIPDRFWRLKSVNGIGMVNTSLEAIEERPIRIWLYILIGLLVLTLITISLRRRNS